MTEQLFRAARDGDTVALAAALDGYPNAIAAREPPYDWSLLHAAAHTGQFAAVQLLLSRGVDPNTREKGDNTYALHWAAAAGHVDVVRALIDAGSDVVGAGDDHALEVIGWATCWDDTDDAPHREIVGLLLARGARHHIFSAIAFGLDDTVRELVAETPAALSRTRSRHEHFELPLQFAVQRNQIAMVELLLALGADPYATDSIGMTAADYAVDPRIDARVVDMLAARMPDSVVLALASGETDRALSLIGASTALAVERGALHLLAKRGALDGVALLLDRGADPNARWNHWGSVLTPLHLAVLGDQPEVARLLLDRGADATIHDSLHDSDALGWAEYMGRAEILKMLRGG